MADARSKNNVRCWLLPAKNMRRRWRKHRSKSVVDKREGVHWEGTHAYASLESTRAEAGAADAAMCAGILLRSIQVPCQ